MENERTVTGQELSQRAERIADLLDDLSLEDAMEVHRAACEPIIYRRVAAGAAETSLPATVNK